MKANKKQNDNGIKVMLFITLLTSALLLLQAVTMWNKAGMIVFGISTLILLIVNAKNDTSANHCDDDNNSNNSI